MGLGLSLPRGWCLPRPGQPLSRRPAGRTPRRLPSSSWSPGSAPRAQGLHVYGSSPDPQRRWGVPALPAGGTGFSPLSAPAPPGPLSTPCLRLASGSCSSARIPLGSEVPASSPWQCPPSRESRGASSTWCWGVGGSRGSGPARQCCAHSPSLLTTQFSYTNKDKQGARDWWRLLVAGRLLPPPLSRGDGGPRLL